MASNEKFPQFADGGIIRQGDVLVGLRSSDLSTNYKFDFPGTGVKDVNGNYIVQWNTVGSTAVNSVKFLNSLTNNPINITAAGDDTNIDININPKGSGALQLDNLNWPTADGTSGQIMSTDGSGNLSFIDNQSDTPSALTRTNDTNVTITLGGTPATALLEPVSITVGWSGFLAATRGGTGLGTYVLGDTLYASGVNTLSALAGNTTTTPMFLSQTGTGAVSAAPSWVELSGAIGQALTRVNDTNVTITLGGAPTTALLGAVSLTVGWSGQLALTRGGSNASLVASNGGLVYSTASAMGILAGTATANQIPMSGSNAAPSWSTATYPPTTTINQLLYSSANNTVAGLATANNSVLTTNGSGVPALTTVGTGLQISAGVLSTTGAAAKLPLVSVNSLTTMTVNTAYYVSSGSVDLNMPLSPTLGDIVEVYVNSIPATASCNINPNTSQTIRYLGNFVTTSGSAGTIILSSGSYIKLFAESSTVWMISVATLGGDNVNYTMGLE